LASLGELGVLAVKKAAVFVFSLKKTGLDFTRWYVHR
jgi:hypothetical protein